MIEAPRCECCEMTLTTRGECPLCDFEGGMTSPPHVCLKSGRIISDEHDCEPTFPPLDPDTADCCGGDCCGA